MTPALRARLIKTRHSVQLWRVQPSLSPAIPRLVYTSVSLANVRLQGHALGTRPSGCRRRSAIRDVWVSALQS